MNLSYPRKIIKALKPKDYYVTFLTLASLLLFKSDIAHAEGGEVIAHNLISSIDEYIPPTILLGAEVYKYRRDISSLIQHLRTRKGQ